MKPTFLFLRPFNEITATAEQLKILYRATKRLGHLVTIQNGEERSMLRLVRDMSYRTSHKSILSKLYSYIHPLIDITLIEANDKTWQELVIEQIDRTDAVIVHLAPRQADYLHKLTEIKPDSTPRSQPSELIEYNPILETGTGQGVLRELNYCKQANALHKVIVLIPAIFYSRVLEAMKVLKLANMLPGRWGYKNTSAGLVELLPRFSELDHSLVHLNEVHSIIPYRKFGGLIFNFLLRQALLACIESQWNSQVATHSMTSQVTVGIPPEPVSLPPDGELKRIRFTPVESLSKPPRHEVVELSFDEVKKMHPDCAEDIFKCQSCGRKADSLFFFQYGLEPNLSKGAMVYMKCQYCGYYENSLV
jgi:hypothetical protein